MLNGNNRISLPRSDLAKVFTDPRTLLAFEAALATVQDTPDAVNAAQATADSALADALAAQTDVNNLILSLGVLAFLDTINDTNWLGAALSVVNGGTGSTTPAGARTNLGLVIGTDVQAFSAALLTYAGIAPSANVQSILGAANYAAINTLLGLGALALLNTVGTVQIDNLAVTNAKLAVGAAVANIGYTPAKRPGFNQKDQAYTLVATDAPGIVFHNEATARVYTIPSGVFAQNDVVTLMNWAGAGALTLTQGAGLTMAWDGHGATGSRALAACSSCVLTYIDTNNCMISGGAGLT